MSVPKDKPSVDDETPEVVAHSYEEELPIILGDCPEHAGCISF